MSMFFHGRQRTHSGASLRTPQESESHASSHQQLMTAFETVLGSSMKVVFHRPGLVFALKKDSCPDSAIERLLIKMPVNISVLYSL
jgi:hypothetical protein